MVAVVTGHGLGLFDVQQATADALTLRQSQEQMAVNVASAFSHEP